MKRGLAFHGEAGLVTWEIEGWDSAANEGRGALTMGCLLPTTHLKIRRTYALKGPVLAIRERISNLCGFERAFGRAQHVTIGEQFLLRTGPSGAGSPCCSFRASCDRGVTWPHEEDAAGALNSQWAVGAEFAYPDVPRRDGGVDAWGAFPRPSAGGRNLDLCTLRCRTDDDWGWFVAERAGAGANASHGSGSEGGGGGASGGMSLACAWPRKAFPWLMTWEENRARRGKPWRGPCGEGTLCRGLELSSYAFATSRRENVARGTLLGQPCFEWLDADETKDDTFFLALQPTAAAGAEAEVPGGQLTGVQLCGLN